MLIADPWSDLAPVLVAALIPSLFAATFLVLYIGCRCNLSVQRDRMARLAQVHADTRDELDAVSEEAGYQQDVGDRLRAAVLGLFGPGAVARIDEALWMAELPTADDITRTETEQ